MRYWSFIDAFGFDNLKLRQAEVPAPGPRDVLIEMRAASLNFRDLVVLRGQHGRAVQPPLIPLSDGVGVVRQIGAEVRNIAVGDRVSPCFFQNWAGGTPPADLEVGRLGGPLDGVLATHRVFPASGVVRVPEHLSDAEVATLPCAGVTAWSALNQPTSLGPGESLLILGSGGVALIALQLAKAVGVRTIVTTSTAERAEHLKALGADLVIDRSTTPDWAKAVRATTGGLGCDRVLELGGAKTLGESLKAVKTGGAVILIGNVTGNTAELFLPTVLTRCLTLRSVTVGSRQAFEALNQAVSQHNLHPVIGKSFTFDDVAGAFAALEQQAVFGKICISIGESSN
ncbi:MAG: NAD(P)-dependent alcohol dehydrogenase [Pseudomonadota bacterium]